MPVPPSPASVSETLISPSEQLQKNNAMKQNETIGKCSILGLLGLAIAGVSAIALLHINSLQAISVPDDAVARHDSMLLIATGGLSLLLQLLVCIFMLRRANAMLNSEWHSMARRQTDNAHEPESTKQVGDMVRSECD